MADLPELSETAKRKLAVQWDTLLHTHGLTGEHFDWHSKERGRLRKIAAERHILGRDGLGRVDERLVDQTGIAPSVAVAKSRFYDLAIAYWSHWSVNAGYKAFADWLDLLKRQVSDVVASIWKGQSEGLDRWYERACRPSLEKALSTKVKEFIGWARAAELKELERATANELSKPLERAATTEGKSQDAPAQPATVANAGARGSLRDRKGDSGLLGDKRAVSFQTAEAYLGISPRQRQSLVKNGVLVVEGQGHNRKITTESLRIYLPSENPKRPEATRSGTKQPAV
jgi:hypothetical protein